MRDYGSHVYSIFDGDPNCQHEFQTEQRQGMGTWNADKSTLGGGPLDKHQAVETIESAFCRKCNAWKGQLGLEPNFDLFLKHLLDIFDEVKRVLKPTGSIYVNLGDSYSASRTYQVNGTKQMPGSQPNKQPMIKPLGIKEKSLCMIPYRFSIAMIDRGWILRNVIIWNKPNSMPSSIKDRYSVDFEPVFFFSKSKKYFFNTQYEPYAKSTENDSRMGKIQQLSKTIKEGYEDAMMQNPKELRQNIFSKGLGLGRIKRTTWTITTKGFSGSHFATFPEELVETPIKASCPEQVCKQCGKPREKIIEPTKEYNKFLGISWHNHSDDSGMGFGHQTRGFSSRKGNVEGIKKYDVTGYTNCGCEKGFEPGIALDMFFGAGTVGLVALKNNRRFIGIELNPEFCAIAEKRLAGWKQQTRLADW